MTANDARNREVPFELGIERRFPLDLESSVPPIWDAYERSLTEVWDPESEVLWDGFEAATLSDDTRAAGALTWSHLAWVEFPAIAESEAVLIRACLDVGVDIDLKYCLAMRAVERARSTDYAHILAGQLGTYESGPAESSLGDLLDAELVRQALHAGSDLDAYLASRLIGQATVDLRMWEAAGRHASGAISKAIELITRDKRRILDVAWIHVAGSRPKRSDEQRAMIEHAVDRVLADEERIGRRVPALLAPSDLRDRLVAANAIAADAGLGGVSESEQRDVFRDAIGELHERFGLLGIMIDPSVGDGV